MKNERGSLTTEVLLLVPCLLGLVLLVVYAGVITRTSFQVQQAATAAARSASLVSQAQSQREAIRTGTQLLQKHNAHCSTARIYTELVKMEEVSAVRVTVSCKVSTHQVGALHVSGITVSRSSTSVIDRYRLQ